MTGERLTERALNRALLARQGLLQRHSGPLDKVAEQVGALQMQYWPSLGPALWSRATDCPAGAAFEAHARGELLTGTLLRGTIHTVSAAEYPAYATVAAASKALGWRRTKDEPKPEVADLERALLDYTAEPRTAAELRGFVESWVKGHPGVLSEAEVAAQYERGWRPWGSLPWFLRATADGRWGPKTPNLYQAAPIPPSLPTTDEALATVARCHLRAFGPAAAEDLASWINWNVTPVRAALQQMDDLVTFTDERGKLLHDLPGAPRPDADVDAPVRLLPWFDSTLLAYAPGRRTRILPEACKDAVFLMRNGQIRATFLVDGTVAGTWSLATARATATLTLTPLRPLTAADRKPLLAEAERLAAFCHPAAKSHEARFADPD